MSSAISAMPQLDQMAELLSKSTHIVPEQLRNKADCFAICLKAMAENKNPMQIIEAYAAPKPAALGMFTKVAQALTSAETGAQLQEAIKLMDEVTQGGSFTEDEGLSLLTICHDRQRAFACS